MRTVLRNIVISLALAVLLCLLLVWGARLTASRTAVSAADLEADLRNAAVCCYAVEGRYPPNLAYLVSEYGVRYDESRFFVFYEWQAANLSPSITVITAKGAET